MSSIEGMRARARKFRITLWGRDKQPIPLSRPLECREGIFLEGDPDGLSGFDVDHLWDVSSGAWRGTARDTNTITLPLVVKGASIRRHVNNLLDQLEAGRGQHPATLVVTSPEYGYRWVRVRLQQASKIQWFTSPGSTPLAKLSVILELAGFTSIRFPESLTLDRTSQFGVLDLPVDGDRPVWPRFRVEGRHGGLRLRLTAADEWQTLPYRPGGWVIDSHPERRLATNLEGVPDFSTVVPFWPEPLTPEGPRRMIHPEVEVTAPGQDFTLTITYTPEASRLW